MTRSRYGGCPTGPHMPYLGLPSVEWWPAGNISCCRALPDSATVYRAGVQTGSDVISYRSDSLSGGQGSHDIEARTYQNVLWWSGKAEGGRLLFDHVNGMVVRFVGSPDAVVLPGMYAQVPAPAGTVLSGVLLASDACDTPPYVRMPYLDGEASDRFVLVPAVPGYPHVVCGAGRYDACPATAGRVGIPDAPHICGAANMAWQCARAATSRIWHRLGFPRSMFPLGASHSPVKAPPASARPTIYRSHDAGDSPRQRNPAGGILSQCRFQHAGQARRAFATLVGQAERQYAPGFRIHQQVYTEMYPVPPHADPPAGGLSLRGRVPVWSSSPAQYKTCC